MNNQFSKLSFLLFLFIMLFSISYQSVSAEDIDLADAEGMFSISFVGKEIGSSTWKLTRKTVSKKEIYELTMEEKKTQNGKEVTASYKALLNKDLSAKSMECEIKQGSSITQIKAKKTGSKISVSTTSAGSKLPARSVKVENDVMWEFCAPLVWTWKKPSPEKEVAYSYLLTVGGSVVSRSLKGKKKDIKTGSASQPGTEWVDSENRIRVQTNEEGDLIRFTSSDKSGKETEYLVSNGEEKEDAEEEELEEDDEEITEDGEEIEETDFEEEGDKVEGDKKGFFTGCLQPVGKKAKNSKKGDYLKIKGKFAIASFGEWKCYEGTPDDAKVKDCWYITNGEDKNTYIAIIVLKASKKIDPEAEDMTNETMPVISQAANKLYAAFLEDKYKTRTIPYYLDTLKFPDKAILYHSKVAFFTRGECSTSGPSLLAQGDDVDVFAAGLAPDDDLNDYNEDFCKILGSLRIIE